MNPAISFIIRPFLALNLLVGLSLLCESAPVAKAEDSTPTEAGPEAHAAFEKLLAAPWRTTFTERGGKDWHERWMLDGLKAEVRPHGKGLYFQAGPIADDFASHAVLWTRASFHGSLRIEFDYTRMDTIHRGVNILYLQATGTGEGPYAADIATWADRREIPAMATYFDHMNLLHVSYAAYAVDSPPASDYVRARRYPRALAGGSFDGMELAPTYTNTGLFLPGQRVRIVVLKDDRWLFFFAASETTKKLYAWSLAKMPPVIDGRIGIRHMGQRAALYENIKISELSPSSP